MELKINNNTVLKNLQNEFNGMYPFLKIEFLPKKGGDIAGKQEKISPALSFRQVRVLDKDVTINVSGDRTVAEVEKDFKDFIGLQIQLYRKSGNVWIETSLTDDWTLERQNKSGEILSIPSFKKPSV